MLVIFTLYKGQEPRRLESSPVPQWKPHISRKYYHFEVSTDFHTKNMPLMLYKVLYIDASFLHMNGMLVRAQSFQTQLPRIDRLAPFVWIVLLVKGFRVNVHIIAVGLYWTACQRIQTVLSLVDARYRNILVRVCSVKHSNLSMLKLNVHTTDKSDHEAGASALLVPVSCRLYYTYTCLVKIAKN
jgi:hypothetical protein